jgi:hypothetical protein
MLWNDSLTLGWRRKTCRMKAHSTPPVADAHYGAMIEPRRAHLGMAYRTGSQAMTAFL